MLLLTSLSLSSWCTRQKMHSPTSLQGYRTLQQQGPQCFSEVSEGGTCEAELVEKNKVFGNHVISASSVSVVVLVVCAWLRARLR